MFKEPELVNCLRQHRSSVVSVCFSPDASNLVTSSAYDGIILWNLDHELNARRCYRISDHTDIVYCVDYSNGGDFWLSASRDCSVRLWRMDSITQSRKEPVLYKCHTNSVRCVNISPTDEYFSTCSDDKSVKVWSTIAKNKQIHLLRGHTNWVRACKYCPVNSQIIASCGDDSAIIVHDLRDFSSLPVQRKIAKQGYMFTCLDWHPNNSNLIAVGSGDNCVRIYDLRSEKLLQFYNVHDSPVTGVTFHPSGNYLLSSSRDESSKIFDLLEGRVLFTLRSHNGDVNSSKFDSSGRYFATVGADMCVNLWHSNLDDNCEKSDETVDLGERSSILMYSPKKPMTDGFNDNDSRKTIHLKAEPKRPKKNEQENDGLRQMMAMMMNRLDRIEVRLDGIEDRMLRNSGYC